MLGVLHVDEREPVRQWEGVGVAGYSTWGMGSGGTCGWPCCRVDRAGRRVQLLNARGRLRPTACVSEALKPKNVLLTSLSSSDPPAQRKVQVQLRLGRQGRHQQGPEPAVQQPSWYVRQSLWYGTCALLARHTCPLVLSCTLTLQRRPACPRINDTALCGSCCPIGDPHVR